MDPAARQLLATTTTVDLTTFGARSGRPVRIEIWFWEVDGRYFVTGTPGPRDWYANVRADPRVVVHVPGFDLPGIATPVADRTVREAVFTLPRTDWYLTQTTLDDLVGNAPFIEITFEAHPGEA